MRMMLIKELPIEQEWGSNNKEFNGHFSVGTVFNIINKEEIEETERHHRDIFYLETKMNEEEKEDFNIASPFPIYVDELTCFRKIDEDDAD